MSTAETVRRLMNPLEEGERGRGTGYSSYAFHDAGFLKPEIHTATYRDAYFTMLDPTAAKYITPGIATAPLWQQGSMVLAVDHGSAAAAMLTLGQHHRVNRHRRVIADRLAELRQDAAEDGAHFNDLSAGALVAFSDTLAADYPPSLFLLPNGNLRAVWQGDRLDRIAVQFLDGGKLQHVIIHHPDGELEQDMGEHSGATVIRSLVASMNLLHLWYRG